ncbi:hypothetical protein [Actinomycetospora aeridis]|uniref:Uncharacterized protein n=1 Tax=Actinomycetospora aeridis TaxID=3129231 RepID=A0ABU8N6E6_9PSEU
MSWECTSCARVERDDASVLVDGVCHHCGVLLCRDDQYVVWDRDVLGATAGGRWAVHCRTCRDDNHRWAVRGVAR